MSRSKTVEQFLADTTSAVRPLDPLNYRISDTQGCVLADDVVTDSPVPRHDEAAVDGYAVRSEDIVDAGSESPVKLAVMGDMAALDIAPEEIRARQAARIRRGLPLPVGADSVVRAGDTDGGFVTVHVRAAVPAGANVSREGSDLGAGATVLKSGDALTPSRIGLLAAMGRVRVLAHPRPRVVVVSLGTAGAEGNDVAGFAITEAARETGAAAYRAGIDTDSAQEFATGVEDHLIRADVVVTSGGVGSNSIDVVRKAFDSIGEVTFDDVAIRPGGAIGFGFVGPERLPVFCLPEDPVAALVEFEVLVRPILLRLAASHLLHRTRIRARCATEVASVAGDREFVGVTIGRHDGAWVALPVSQGPMRLPQLASSHGLLDIPARIEKIAEGDLVDVIVTDEVAAAGQRLSVP